MDREVKEYIPLTERIAYTPNVDNLDTTPCLSVYYNIILLFFSCCRQWQNQIQFPEELKMTSENPVLAITNSLFPDNFSLDLLSPIPFPQNPKLI